MEKNAQGALEYLLLIGGGVVVAAVVTVLVIGLSSTSTSVTKSTADDLAKITFIAANSGSIKTYLKFDDFSDSSSNPPAYTSNGATITAEGGYFNGSSYMSTANAASRFNYTQNGFTYMAWIKPTAYSNTYNMFMGQLLPYFNVGSGSNNQKLHMSMNAAGAQRSVYGSTVIPLNQWTHVAATYDGQGYMKVYVNGVLDGTSGPYLTPANYGYEMFIGQWQPGASYRYTGYIDEVIVVDYALTPEQIKILAGI